MRFMELSIMEAEIEEAKRKIWLLQESLRQKDEELQKDAQQTEQFKKEAAKKEANLRKKMMET